MILKIHNSRCHYLISIIIVTLFKTYRVPISHTLPGHYYSPAPHARRSVTSYTALAIRYCCTATAMLSLVICCISIYTAISCPDMKVHGNRRQGGFLCPKVGVVRFSTSRKRHLKSTNPQNKIHFVLALIQLPLTQTYPPEDRLGSPNFIAVTSLHATLPSRD